MLQYSRLPADFNPLPRKEGDNSRGRILHRGRHFNPLPRKEGDSWRTMLIDFLLNFNPLPRKEGDLL